jgi:hypothetical protein
MTSKQSQQDQLTDSGYIEWAKQQEWSLTQAIYLLHGEDPPGSEQNEQVKTLEGQIEWPTAKNLFQRHEEVRQRIEHLETLSRQSPEDEMLKRDLAQLKADYLSPASWIHYAATIGIDVNNCWEALFHEYLAPELDYALFEKQEYSRFIRIFVTDEWTPLEYLVLYVKELPMDQLTYTSGDARTVKEEFDELLLKMNTALDLKERLVDLPGCQVSPRAFIQEYCRLHPNHKDRFTMWGGWLSDHKKLAAFLKPRKQKRKEIKVKRVRRDAVTSNIHKYLESCTTSNASANIDDCWKFLANELDIHGDGYLISYTQKGKALHTTKEQVSGRFNEALKNYTSK